MSIAMKQNTIVPQAQSLPMVSNALVRLPSESMGNGLTKPELVAHFGAFDIAKATKQMHTLVEVLRKSAGIPEQNISTLPAIDHLPDSQFMRDPIALMLKDGNGDSVAILGKMAEPSRSAETYFAKESLISMGTVGLVQLKLKPGDTVEGGDVHLVGKDLIVGVGGRTTPDGAMALIHAAREIDPEITGHMPVVDYPNVLHLDSAVTVVTPRLMLHDSMSKLTTNLPFKTITLEGNGIFPYSVMVVNDVMITQPGFMKHVVAQKSHPDGKKAVEAMLLHNAITTHNYKVVELDLSQYAAYNGGIRCLLHVW